MKSQFEILKGLLADEKVNWIKVDYFKRAKFDMAAWFRLQTGETKQTGGIKKASIMSSRAVGSSSPSLLLTMARETGSRKDDESFDFRSMILAALCVGGGMEQNVTEIGVNYNFKSGFEGVSLAGLPVFPQFADEKEEKEWAEHFLTLQTLRVKKELLTKQMTAIKKKLDKKAVVEQDGHKFYFEEPEGTTDAILDKDGKKVPQVASEVAYLCLDLMGEPSPSVPKYGLGEIVKLQLEINSLSNKCKDLTANLRPYELGILERFQGNRKDSFNVGGIPVKISEGYSKGSYQHSSETAEKVKTGEYTVAQVPKEKGKWVCEPLVKGTVEMTQSETVGV